MKIPINYSFPHHFFSIKDYPFNHLNSQHKKITLIVFTIFCALAIGYYLISSYISAKKKEPSPFSSQQDEKIHYEFNEQIKQKSKSRDKSNNLKSSSPDHKITIKEKNLSSILASTSEITSEPEIKEKTSDQILTEEASVVHPSLEQSPTVYQAYIALQSRAGLLAGPEIHHEPELFDFYEWKLPDGSDLPVQENTLLLKFMLFHQTQELKQLNRQFSIYLPTSLFDDKKEGDIIELRYRRELVRLQINQDEISSSHYRRHVNFEDVFTCTVQNALHDIETGCYGFCDTLYGKKYASLTAGYTMKFGGALYHFKPKDLEESSEAREITRSDPKNFRKVGYIKSDVPGFYRINTKRVRINESEDAISFILEMPGIGKQVDIVVNERFLSFYSRDKSLGPSSFSPIEFEYLEIIRWKLYFENFSLQEMQECIQNSVAHLETGYFVIKIPKGQKI